MAVITAAEYKTWAGVSGTALDSWLTQTIPEAQAFAETWCDRGFDTATRTEYYDGHGTPDIQLRSTPVTTLTSVSYISGVASGAASFTAFDSSSYFVDQDSGVLQRASAFDAFETTFDRYDRPIWPEGIRNIKVVYVGGYGAIGGPAMPSGLKLATYRLVDYLRNERGRSGEMQSETMGSYSYTRASIAGVVTDELMGKFGFGLYRRGLP